MLYTLKLYRPIWGTATLFQLPSPAKRLLARVELFKVVLFGFREVDSIGQAFADEIFRVFAKAHPEIELLPVYANRSSRRTGQGIYFSAPWAIRGPSLAHPWR